MKYITLFVLLLTQIPPAQAASYGVARSATPVLNIPALGAVFKAGGILKSDRCGQVRELEFVALPGTVFRIIERRNEGTATIYRVETEDYPTPYKKALYLDSRFVDPVDTKPSQRLHRRPSRQEILDSLKGAVGQPYVWGGNVSAGVPELAEYYYRTPVQDDDLGRLFLEGLDCSGLLYQATNGSTPRNTSELVSYGRPVAIQGRTAGQISRLLEPLDLIVWNGHVIIVLDRETVIESRLECGKTGNGGVVMTPLRKRLAEVMHTRRPGDAWPLNGMRQDVFVVRRWYEL